MTTTKVLVLAGGVSAEKEISQRSGENIYQALIKAGFNTTILDPANTNFSYDNLKNFDVVYPILHGTKGEDGCIQGVLESLNIPYVGCDVLASALTMDKAITKQLFHQLGIPCAQGFVSKGSLEEILQNIEKISYPVFVKPVNEGSSVGSLILHNREEALDLLPKHLSDYPYALIEQLLIGREMTVGVICLEEHIQILPILELRPKAEFYNYETKYTAGMTEFILPAEIDPRTLDTIHQQVSMIFQEFQLRDCVRIDLILTEQGPVYLEVNTAPGMTATSDIPAMLSSAGIDITEFVDKLISKALRRSCC
ncbi:MAG: D-alanine--D-alanine ligase family protein [Brevinema sp.]